jgi:hypothetical protein
MQSSDNLAVAHFFIPFFALLFITPFALANNSHYKPSPIQSVTSPPTPLTPSATPAEANALGKTRLSAASAPLKKVNKKEKEK